NEVIGVREGDGGVVRPVHDIIADRDVEAAEDELSAQYAEGDIALLQLKVGAGQARSGKGSVVGVALTPREEAPEVEIGTQANLVAEALLQVEFNLVNVKPEGIVVRRGGSAEIAELSADVTDGRTIIV